MKNNILIPFGAVEEVIFFLTFEDLKKNESLAYPKYFGSSTRNKAFASGGYSFACSKEKSDTD
ncbi:hypothetical protein P872_19670 [Rhodonellum psychrophilum GCM71 = DSM 17998]|uniref:Uncharacterized protein n=1 Tax=Rhodonellum psychrophilum GCM71 = DSM 17998 TaxID=1123057 RepID=U5BV03_9BACT|nr:hypothetical protein P872_19670 [Rhodonellum psychrophilum GCM71 = DSM 17998]